MTVPVLKIKVIPKPVIKGRMDVRFPAGVQTEKFLTVSRSNGTYTFGVDFSALTPGPVSDPETAYVAIEDQTAGIYRNVTLASLLTSGIDADLQAIAALTGSGVLARAADNTWELRAIAGTENEITVSDGDGVAGPPTVSLPDALTFTGKTVTGGTFESPAINAPTGIVKADVGLGNVDNTSDADKPVSTGTQTALDLKANIADLGTAAAADTTDFATAAQGVTADSAVQPGDLATVATSGSYTDLSSKPYTVPAGGSTGQALVKASATDGDTEWGDAIGGGGSTVDTIAALKGLDTSAATFTFLTEAGREGAFAFRSGDYSAHISTDTNEGVYVKATAIAASSGAWVRLFNFQDYQSKWFGAVDDYATDNTSIINSVIAVANLPNTTSGAGKQRAAFINIEGGVKFATKNLTWLPAENWIFVYVNYFGNSNTTPGSGLGIGTNERETLSVNSGYPEDVTGGFVAENMFHAPLHPAIGVNIDKAVDSSIASHLPSNQAIQPTATIPVRASAAWISDERLEKFRIMYQKYGKNDTTDGVIFYTMRRTTDLSATNVGVAGGWAGSAVPVAGDVVRDVTTGGRYVVRSLATSILSTDWLSGAAAPGNTLMRERAIFRGSISGTALTVTAVDQGSISTGHTIVGIFANSGITAGTTITGQNTGTPGGVGVYTVNNSQAVAATQLVTGNLALNNIQGGGVTNTDTAFTPLLIGLDGRVTFNQNTLPGSLTPLADGAGAATGTLTNAPAAGNPTKWLFFNDGGTTRRIPAW